MVATAGDTDNAVVAKEPSSLQVYEHCALERARILPLRLQLARDLYSWPILQAPHTKGSAAAQAAGAESALQC